MRGTDEHVDLLATSKRSPGLWGMVALVIVSISAASLWAAVGAPSAAAVEPCESKCLILESEYTGTLHYELTGETLIKPKKYAHEEQLGFAVQERVQVGAAGYTVEIPTIVARGTLKGETLNTDEEWETFDCTLSATTGVQTFGHVKIVPAGVATLPDTNFVVFKNGKGESVGVEYDSNPSKDYRTFTVESYVPLKTSNGNLGVAGSGECLREQEDVADLPNILRAVSPDLAHVAELSVTPILAHDGTTTTPIDAEVSEPGIEFSISGQLLIRVSGAAELFPTTLEQVGPTTPVPPTVQHNVPETKTQLNAEPQVQYEGGGGSTGAKGGGATVNTGQKATCPKAVTSCALHADLTAVLPPGLAHLASRTKLVKLGTTSRTLAGGQSATIFVNISPKVVALLRRLHHLKATVAVTISAGATPAVTHQQEITLTPPRARQH
jgi:hypothetical protein